jgi:endonuclease-3 related protein
MSGSKKSNRPSNFDARGLYQRLLRAYGPQGWWPVVGSKSAPGYDARFEIILGAILTQMVAWGNVQKALLNLRAARALSLSKIRSIKISELQKLIKPTGFYRQKAKKIKMFIEFLDQDCGGRLDELQAMPVKTLRTKLLSVKGIGEETADSIILYAFGKPSFVIDAYTQRLGALGGLKFSSYGEQQKYFEARLPRSVKLWREYHALIVRWGKDYGRGNKKTSAAAFALLRVRRVRDPFPGGPPTWPSARRSR